jgi:hypothetical protein
LLLCDLRFVPWQVHVIQGMGRYVSMAPSGEYLYARLAKRDQQVARKVEREPYRGPVINLTESVGSLLSSSTPAATSIPTPTAAPAAPALVEKPRSNPIVQQVDTPPANATQPPAGAQQGSGDFHNRPATRGGVRNQQDSSFNFAGMLFCYSFEIIVKPNQVAEHFAIMELC